MNRTRYLIARGYTFAQIAHAAGLDVTDVYRAYLGQDDPPEIRTVYRLLCHTGKLQVRAKD